MSPPGASTRNDILLFGIAVLFPALRPMVAALGAADVAPALWVWWEQIKQQQRGNFGEGASAPQSAAEVDEVMEAVPPHLRKKAYLALAKVLHPDAGGDEEAFKRLQGWYDRVG